MITIRLLYENDNPANGRLSTDTGRVKIVYYEKDSRLQIANGHTGEVLLDQDFTFTLTGFIKKINEYDIICNHK